MKSKPTLVKIRRLKKRRITLAKKKKFYESNPVFRWIFKRDIEDLNRIMFSISVDIMLTGLLSIAKVFEISNSIKDIKKLRRKNVKEK